MVDHKLNDREELILRAVVHQYITGAEPVGSRAIVRKFDLDISPATVRNVMADLEEYGYLQQLHTSSGRVPTDRGYRYYVDYLMSIQEVTAAERVRLERDLADRINDTDQIMREASRLLALLSHQTGIVEAPQTSETTVKAIEVIPVAGERVAVLVADDIGQVRTMVIASGADYSDQSVESLNRFLNENLRGAQVGTLTATMRERMGQHLDDQRALAEQSLYILDALPGEESGKLYLDGAMQLFEQPEFRDVDQARQVFGLLEERDQIAELLRAGVVTSATHSSRIVIGSESSLVGTENLSIVAAPYRIGDAQVGMLGVLGPRRMPYSRLSGLVEYTAGMLGRMLTRIAR